MIHLADRPARVGKALLDLLITKRKELVADTSEGRARIPKDLDRLMKWSAIIQMKFNTDMCKILYSGCTNADCTNWSMLG